MTNHFNLTNEELLERFEYLITEDHSFTAEYFDVKKELMERLQK